MRADSLLAALILVQGGDDPLDHAVDRLAGFVPAPHEDDVMFGIYPDNISAVANGSEA
jgi:hypothetical protein